MIFKEYKGLDLIKISNEILDFWKNKSIFKKSIESKEKNKNFIFYEGPPSANGTPGIHHMMGRTIKDIFCIIIFSNSILREVLEFPKKAKLKLQVVQMHHTTPYT